MTFPLLLRCLGGTTSWTNVVAACQSCNHRKGRQLLKTMKGMNLIKLPIAPNHAQLQAAARVFPPQHLHKTWEDYVYWDGTLKE
jgi:5-methylcytosine-specific restriction endonuclease McrA